MRLICFIIVGFMYTNCASVKGVDRTECKALIDSAKEFIQTENFAINFRPSKYDKIRNDNLDKYFQKISFQHLCCLLNDKDISIQFVGFEYAAFAYKESLMKKYSDMFKDTTAVKLMYRDGKESDFLRYGDVLKMVIQKSNE